MKRIFQLSVLFLIALFSFGYSDQLGNEIGTYELFYPLARTQTVGTYGSRVVDCNGFRSGVVLWQTAKSSAGSACSAYVVVQESNTAVPGGGLNNMTASTADSLGLRNTADSTNWKLAFSVTQDSSRTISSVTLKMRKVGSPTTTNGVILSIQTDNSGDPSGTQVHADAIDTVLISSIGSTWQWVTFTFERPVDLTASTTYHYVLTGNYTISTANYISVYLETVGSGGDVEYAGANGAWTQVATSDIVGKILRYNFTNIAATYMDTATHNVAAFDTKDIDLRNKKRYIRAKATIVGTSGSFVSSGAVILGEPLNKPVGD